MKSIRKSRSRTTDLLDAMCSGLAINQAAGTGAHGSRKGDRCQRRSNREEARRIRQGAYDED